MGSVSKSAHKNDHVDNISSTGLLDRKCKDFFSVTVRTFLFFMGALSKNVMKACVKDFKTDEFKEQSRRVKDSSLIRFPTHPSTQHFFRLPPASLI